MVYVEMKKCYDLKISCVGCKKVLLQCFVAYKLNEITSADLYFTGNGEKSELVKTVYVCCCYFDKTFLGINSSYLVSFNDCWFHYQTSNARYAAACYECTYWILRKEEFIKKAFF